MPSLTPAHLSHFFQIDQLELLRGLFLQILVPTVVVHEVAPSLGTLPSWIDVQNDFAIPALLRKLDAGERAAIALATHVSADFVVLDDLAGRTMAAELGRAAMGSFGLLVRAKQRGLIGEVRPMMDEMISHGLYTSEGLYHRILSFAGENE